jgi:hypothetical protein
MQCIIVLLFNLYQYYVGQAFRAAPPKGMVRQPLYRMDGTTYDLIT